MIGGVGVFLCMNQSYAFAPLGIANLFNNTMPFWIAVGSFIILKERITVLQIICMIVAFSGVAVICLNTDNTGAYP